MRGGFIAVLMLAASTAAAARAATGGSEAALSWLSAVDHGAYAQSWAAAGAMFRSQISSAAWAQKVGAVREPLGRVISRTLTSEKQTTSLPGAPDGHYDVLTFGTDFATKHGSVETVVLADEADGWKVDGYFIK